MAWLRIARLAASLLTIIVAGALPVRAADVSTSSSAPALIPIDVPPPADTGPVLPFGRNSLILLAARNHPAGETDTKFTTGPVHPIVGYRTLIDDHWLMGGSFQFRIFSRPEGGELPFISLNHETYQVVRLYHPLYLLAGAKFFYLLPVESARLPARRNNEYRAQIGIAASAQFMLGVAENWHLLVTLDRWRGTANLRLEGLEIAGGVVHTFD